MQTDLKYFDIHGHLNFSDYDSDLETVIGRARELQVGIITVGTDIESSKRAVELANMHENMWAVVGFHPTDAKNVDVVADINTLSELASNPKVIAIGECGLDYFHSTSDEIPRQREIFEKHIELANTVGKPLMLHIRNGKANPGSDELVPHNAYQEAIKILKEKANVRGNFHFFAGTLKDAQDIVAMGNTMSFTGVITFARNYDQIIKHIPLEKIMSETDCPFVPPIPYRGKRNEPSYVVEVVKKIAEIRGEDEEVVARQLVDNTKKFFTI